MTEPLIPVRNLYYLYCYAWDRFEEGKAIALDAEASPDLPNLLARVLASGTRSLLRRGLDRSYLSCQEEISTVRSHIELAPTLRLHARNRRRIDCTFDELSHDVLHNQLLKATLKRLLKLGSLDPGLAGELHRLRLRMADVSEVHLTAAAFGRVQLHRNNARYDLLLKVCALVFDATMPIKGGKGRYVFEDVLRDERKMAQVFESFVRGFYRATQRRYRVRPLQLEWQAVPIATNNVGQLPTMRTDVYLESEERRIIMDTKYYVEALQERFGAMTFKSTNLYQLFAYLRNDALTRPEAIAAEGMLLYPQVGSVLDSTFKIHGHVVRIATVDLAQPWSQIEGRLAHLAVDDLSMVDGMRAFVPREGGAALQ